MSGKLEIRKSKFETNANGEIQKFYTGSFRTW